jgi:hypothetical protein
MRTRGGMTLVAALILGCAALAAVAAGGSGETVLLDAPRGAWLANVRGGASLVVLEERDGWRRVRLEGWMPADGTGTPSGAPAVAAGGGMETGSAIPETVPSSAGVVVTGVLVPIHGMEPATPGGNLVVLLVGNLASFDAEHRALGVGCRASMSASDEKIAALQNVEDKALNSTGNLAEATRRYDQAKADLAAARHDRAEALEGCRGRADALFARYAVARTLSEPSGRFEFRGVAPGTYRVIAGEHSASGARSWSIDCVVGEGAVGDVVIDPRTAPPGPDAYWGLR